MAVYRFAAQVIGRSSGRSATGAAAYRSAATIADDRTGLIHDYRRKGGVLHVEIMAPGDAPAWMQDRAALWNAVETVEKRKDAQLAREILLNLPHELTDAQRRELVREFVAAEFVAHGMVADICIHAPHRQGDDRNHHAHVMLTMRALTAEGFGGKARDWNATEKLEHWREEWAAYQNRALEQAGRSERVDSRSLEAQGIDREPEPKQGPVATEMERNGKSSKAGDDRRATQERNAERKALREEFNVISLELVRLERQEREDAARRVRDQRDTPRVEREQGRFSQWANNRRAELQSAQLDESVAQERDQQADTLTLAVQHAEARAQWQPELSGIRQRQQARGLAGVVYRLTGRAGQDTARAAVIADALKNLEGRHAEARQVLVARQQPERAALARRQAQQVVQLEQRIERAREKREAEGWQGRETAQQRSQTAHRQTRRAATTGQQIDPEAEFSPVEGVEKSGADSQPADPEATQNQSAGQSDGREAERTWTQEERAAAIAAERAAREKREAIQRENDLDRGRELKR